MKAILLGLTCIILYLNVSTNSALAQIKSNHQSGSVSFSGQHAGMNFKGKFERWQATLILPPLSDPRITATFYLNSAKTGDSIYDSTLPEFDWFDVENHPQAKFVSTKLVSSQNGYQISGNLTLKGITAPVEFTLIETSNKLVANFDINRLTFNIGRESDPDAEWVGKTISLALVINK